jgi:D-galactose 1-dehydrogenase
MTIRIALVGFGKIAKDEHLPAIMTNPDFELAAIVSHCQLCDIMCAYFPTFDEMLAALPGSIDAVAICTPPGPRFAMASESILAGIPVLFEKPPTATLGELDELIELAATHDVPIHTAWHSQYAAGVGAAAQALAGEKVASLTMLWYEDVRKYHAGQQWIWEADGFGVFDTGINGLSILTHILDEPLLVRDVSMLFPANKHSPISAEVTFHGQYRKAIFDWRGGNQEQWSIEIETKSGKSIRLTDGGARLDIDGVPQELSLHDEYRAIYQDFAKVVALRRSKIDREPLRIVADCFMVGERKMCEDFV